SPHGQLVGAVTAGGAVVVDDRHILGDGADVGPQASCRRIVGDAQPEEAGAVLRIQQTGVAIVDRDLRDAGGVGAGRADGGAKAVLDDRHRSVVDGGVDVGGAL